MDHWQAKTQDFHAVLSFAVQSFVDLQERGMIWDLAERKKVNAKMRGKSF